MKKFHHVKDIDDIQVPQRNNKDGKRVYVTPAGHTYPSITSILSANPEKKKSLARWRKRVGDVEANRISRTASARGTVVHKICEDYLNNEGEVTNGEMPDAIEMRPMTRKKVPPR